MDFSRSTPYSTSSPGLFRTQVGKKFFKNIVLIIDIKMYYYSTFWEHFSQSHLKHMDIVSLQITYNLW